MFDIATMNNLMDVLLRVLCLISPRSISEEFHQQKFYVPSNIVASIFSSVYSYISEFLQFVKYEHINIEIIRLC